ncbi:hypothetical protein L7F22_025146 [Adiantum nelumboides]|nr:hypothetical protein [Adiantum nelumboides]
MTIEAEPFMEVTFVGSNKCEEKNSNVLEHAKKEDVLDKDAKVEIVEGCNCEEQDPKMEVPIEKEGVLEKDSLENKDRAENCPSSMKDNEIVEEQVLCASNIEDQVDKNTEFFVLNTGEDTKIIIEKFEPPQENGDACMDAGGDAICAGGVVGVGGGGAAKYVRHNDGMVFQPWEDGVDAGGDARDEDKKIIIEKLKPPQDNGDASVDASCEGGATGAGYVRHNDGTGSWPWKDGGDVGGDARGDAGYVRNDDEMVSCPWEDPRNVVHDDVHTDVDHAKLEKGTLPTPSRVESSIDAIVDAMVVDACIGAIADATIVDACINDIVDAMEVDASTNFVADGNSNDGETKSIVHAVIDDILDAVEAMDTDAIVESGIEAINDAMVVDACIDAITDAMIADACTYDIVDAMEVDASTDVAVEVVYPSDVVEDIVDAEEEKGTDATVEDMRGFGEEDLTKRVPKTGLAVDNDDVMAFVNTTEAGDRAIQSGEAMEEIVVAATNMNKGKYT